MTTRWPRPDFLAPPRRVPVLAWLWLATAALVLVATLVEARAAQREVEAQRTRLAQANQRIARAPVPRVATGAGPAGAKPGADAVPAAQRLTAQLEHPWGQILSSIEAETPAGLQWLLFEHATSSSDLRFEGVAPDIPIVLQLVDVLSARAGWSEVALGRLQAEGAREGAVGWRFEIQAVVDARRIAVGRSEPGP